MKILGIETSCDETSCAVVEDGRKVMSNVIASQVDIHAKTGGVVPEVAARQHVLHMIPVLDECFEVAGCDWEDIDAIAVTRGPGLVSSLIIGTETANVISYLKDKPLIPVQHIVGHIYSNWLEVEDEVQFPILVLTVSGGHNELILMTGHNEFEVLGETRDDAAGEAFDKVARLLGLGYPGGPAISRAAEDGDSGVFDLPRPYLEKGSLDFSFSGLKTAVLDKVTFFVRGNGGKELPYHFKANLSASFQEAVVDVLSNKLVWALERFPEVKEVHLAGGVSANLRLREVVGEKISVSHAYRQAGAEMTQREVKFRHPKTIRYCTDNAAMIASAGYFLYSKNPSEFKPSTNITPTTSFSIEE